MGGTLVAGDLIRSARDLHPSFDDRRHPDPTLLRALSRYRRELLARLIRLDPSLGVTYLDTALPLADFAAGIAVPAYKYPSHVEVTPISDGLVRPVDLVSWSMHAAYLRAVYLRDGVLYLTGEAADWTAFSSLRFYYVAEPAALALVLTSIVSGIPDAAESCLVAYLSLLMGRRTKVEKGEPPLDVRALAQDWQLSEDRLFDELGRNTQAVTSVVRSTF